MDDMKIQQKEKTPPQKKGKEKKRNETNANKKSYSSPYFYF